ncbi:MULTISPECIES: glutathione S-transferase family protein [unclassified Roseibium]|uniref:glutathione S-transferase family protein n=1 Tax=unclassified Roseibium TaxID=2629323 RepID=UPI00317DBF3C
MTTLFHAPNSRSSTVVALIEELGAPVDIQEVTIPRHDGSGSHDPRNPHPEKKVPFLVDGDERVRERGAIMLYLTDRYPQAGLGPVEGAPGRGDYLSWMFYYQGVMEPVIVLHMVGVSHPVIDANLRNLDAVIERLAETLERRPYLLGEDYSAADLLCSSVFLWLPDLMPDNKVVRDWITRCGERPSVKRALERDAQTG